MPIRCLHVSVFMLVAAAGCSAPPVHPDASSSQATERIPGIVSAADPGCCDEEPDLALLVRGLDDRDAAVRAFSIESLLRLTGEQFGYRWYRDAAGRRDAVASWEAWLAGQSAPGRG